MNGMRHLSILEDQLNSKAVGELQGALRALKLDIAPSELARKELGASTTEALHAFQERAGLPPGDLNAETVTRLNAELAHNFVAGNKTRTARLQAQLAAAGLPVDAAELKSRHFGPATEAALQQFKARVGLPQDGRVTDDVVTRLREDALKARLESKAQIGEFHRTLTRALHVAKIDVQVDQGELRKHELGATSRAALQAVQQKYGLPVTGELDPATHDRLVSIAASVPNPAKLLKVKGGDALKPIAHTARVNMKGQHVAGVQQALAFLGYPIEAQEFKAASFGKTTRAAVMRFQRDRGLQVNGHVEQATLASLNQAVAGANPAAAAAQHSYRIRGSIRNELWVGMPGVKIQIWQKLIQGQGPQLAERPSGPGGFFDIPYEAPKSPTTKQVERPFHLEIRALDAQNQPLGVKVVFNPTLIAWVNFTLGDQPYRGESVFAAQSALVAKAIGGAAIKTLKETDDEPLISRAAQSAGLTADEVMRLVLAHLVAAKLNHPPLGPETCFAFIGQNLPPALPADLVGSTEAWELIDQLVDLTVNGLVFMDAGLQKSAWENAVVENLAPIAVGLQKDAVLQALAALQQTYALEQPLLPGNASLKTLLDVSAVDANHYGEVAKTFLAYGSLGPAFWSDAEQRPADFGGPAALHDLRTTVDVGFVTKNFTPMVQLVKAKIADPVFQALQRPSDAAKLTSGEWEQLIQDNGIGAPPGTDGQNETEQVKVYAATLANQAERLFPAVALAARVAASPQNPLPNLARVQELLDNHPDLDLRNTNLNTFAMAHNLNLDADVLTEARVLQRVNRLAPTATGGQVLLDQKLHNSSQIVALGKPRFLETVMQNTAVDRRVAMAMWNTAEFQYAQVLKRLGDFRFELHRADPAAIVRYTYTAEELAAVLPDRPDLETLFGSLDFCDCPHCQSVYGPAAYLADVLRFLDALPAEAAGRSALDVLFDRRPDIGNVKLNCPNTETPMPYVDLVCEVLENALAAPTPNPNFSLQTTLTAAELRAFPEHERRSAYDLLKTADFPIDTAFNLWQEGARVFLQHLGVPRWELMEAFQKRPDGGPHAPTDASIAGEYWGLSSHEATRVTTQENTAARQDIFWGRDTTQTGMVVADFLQVSRLSYGQLLELLYVQWITPSGAADGLMIERPNATCDTSEQKLTNLTVDCFDQLHRFLRFWRHTKWAMWELDLLLRLPSLGNNQIDGAALVRLKQFRQLQEQLQLSTERGLTLFGDINTEVRRQPDAPQRTIQPLYHTMFLDPVTVGEVDPAFSLPLGGGEPWLNHKPTLLAAFTVNDVELTELVGETDGMLTLANLSAIARRVILARALGLRVPELLTLLDLHGGDPFATPKDLLDFVEVADWVTKSAFAVDELKYLLRNVSDSPYGLREETITGHVEALREALRTKTAAQADGTIISQVAAAFVLTAEQSQLLLTRLRLGGNTLLTNLQNPALMLRDAAGVFNTAITRANFTDIYDSFELLNKAARLVSRFKLDKDDLGWLLNAPSGAGLLDWSALPVGVAPAASFGAWLALRKWTHLRGLHPEPEGTSLAAIFTGAAGAGPAANIHAQIARLTQWPAAELDDLAVGLGLQHGGGAVSDYLDVDVYLRLVKCFGQMKRTGAGAKAMLTWADRETDGAGEQAAISGQIRQAAKSKYVDAVWLEKATPLEDALRERKRDALITTLVETSQRNVNPTVTVGGKAYPNPGHWRDADDLLSYYLIDVQMSACQLTSRIKQAISSTQMYVQRCLLGREQPFVEVSRAQLNATSGENNWGQWKWMRSYRLWEANRKVFLYPENWIEPELRDDKSPFFQELESEILQKEITDENVEAAFRRYVQKVHEVARLDIVGAYYEVDDTAPGDGLPPDINRLHVIGRTRGQPAVYYYRIFDLNYGEWTAWEKIDLDIQSDQVIPVVYNRRLHLFWLLFLEKPQKVRKQPPAQPSDKTDAPQPANQLEIQLVWSTRRDGGWTSKRVSAQKLIHPWQRPLYSYNLKPRYKSRENLLWLDLYISQSPEFNNTRFWDPYRNVPDFVARQRYNETTRPWHSSSFVFDGEVVDVKLKGLSGLYRILDSSGVASNDLTATTSYIYVRDNFGDAGRATGQLSGGYEIAPRLPLPDGMHYENTQLVNNRAIPNNSIANVLDRGATRTLLTAARSPFEIVFSQHNITFDATAFGPMPFFYQDNFRSFFIKPELAVRYTGYNQSIQVSNYTFYPFYHPYTALFLRELGRLGLDGLLNRRIQTAPGSFYPGNSFDFSHYSPAWRTFADKTATKDIVDFERYGAYSIYNWEIFFHAPLLIATKLSANQRFDEAMRWFHYIFDPTNTDVPDVPQRYWITRPFFEQNAEAYRQQRITTLLENIEQHKEELTAWKNHPFKPHLIARYRPVAYQKAVVMKYIDSLTAWGDHLFRQDTIETINQATTLYVLAHELLGRRPVKAPHVDRADRTYNELTADGALDPFGNKRVDVLLENFTGTPVHVTPTEGGSEPLPRVDVFYFGIPHNEQLLGYWDRVEDRLFKIRHCMNIQGVVRQLPLFEPPIDPALLVKAAAAGVDLSSVLSDMAAAPSAYRFRLLAQKALELCGEVRAMGDKLLSALQNFDSEGLSLLRSTQEIRLQQAVREVRKQQIREANENWAGLEKSKELAQQKKDFYESRDFMNAWEITALSLGGVSALAETAIAVGYALAGGLSLIPRFTTGGSGFGGSPHITVDPVNGMSLSKASEQAVQVLSSISRAAEKLGSLASTVGGYTRRQEDWDFQGQLATTEIAQVEKQIAAAQVRLAIAEKELENQELQIEQSQAADEYLRSKYTNQQLFDWQVRQVSALYFQAYQLAYDLAKRAEQCYRFEIGDRGATFIQFGYWDSLKKGLLAGERLANDIHRMEAAYLDQDTRDLEITKHVSLAQFMPLSLVTLKSAGACTVQLPEWLFDMDYPGHYRRRIKSASVSIPCVVGPYSGVNCTVSLVRHAIRTTDDTAAGYGDPLGAPDARFFQSPAPVTVIATSHGQNDAGVFELNLNDERYLPFEGAGTVSEWRIELPAENNQFDLATVADVVLHVRYTARPSSNANLATLARANVNATLPNQGVRLLILNHEFASAWQRFLHPAPGTDQTLALTLSKEHLPFYVQRKANIHLTRVDLILESADGGDFSATLKLPGQAAATPEAAPADPQLGGRPHLAKTGLPGTQALLGDWEIQFKKQAAGDFRSLAPEDIRNAYLLVGFKTS